MTLEQTYYEYKPYAFAFIGLWSIAHATSQLGSFSGSLLFCAAIFIGVARYQFRTSSAKLARKKKSRGSDLRMRSRRYRR